MLKLLSLLLLIHVQIWSMDVEVCAMPPAQKGSLKQPVHYIWMGDLDSNAHKVCCKLGPTSLAQFGANADVFLWVSEFSLEHARLLLKEYDLIQVRSVSSLLDGCYADLKFIKNHVPLIKEMLAKMEKTRSFTAQKDLLSFAVVAEFGGYFLDCTTRFVKPITVPSIGDLKVALHADDRDLIARYPWCNVDIWFFAAFKAGHKVFLNALYRHLNDRRAKKWDKDYTGIAPDFLRDALAIYYSSEPSKETVYSLSWLKEEHPGGYGWIVDEISLEKINTGLWRNTPALNAPAYEELGLLELLPTKDE